MTPILTQVLCIIAGFGLGTGFFMALKVNSMLYLNGGRKWPALLLHIFRFALTIWMFWILAGLGAMPLLLSFGGFLLGRFFVMHCLLEKAE